MSETIRFILTRFTDEAILIAGSCLLLVVFIFIVFWYYNRRKFHKLKHQIPASIVKSYLDSVIQNSTALKSSLFRGEEMNIAGDRHEKVPSVLSMKDITSMTLNHAEDIQAGSNVEGMQQKNAEIASLKNKLADKNKIVEDLENQLKGRENTLGLKVDQQEFKLLQKEKISLEEELSSLKSSTNQEKNISTNDTSQIDSLTKERDELKKKLFEYSILKEENAQLKKTIDDSSKQTSAQPEKKVEEIAPKKDITQEEQKKETTTNTKVESKKTQSSPSEGKTTEELLSEFEKMLG